MTERTWTRRALLRGGAAAAATTVLAACADDGEITVETLAPQGSVPTTGDQESAATVVTAVAGEPPPTLAEVTDDAYVPPPHGAGEWATVAPADAGFTEEGIAALVDLVGSRASDSFILLRHGRIVAEAYWRGADQEWTRDIASCQKSVTSTLVGVARDEGLLGLDDTVTSHLGAGWSAAAKADEALITVRHLLTMTSGLGPLTLKAKTAPGEVWEYNTNAYQKLRPVLEAATGQDIDSLTRAWLLDTVGASEQATWRQRRTQDPTGDRLWGLELTVRDMARFGLMAMRGGMWGDTRVLPDGWLDESWTPIPQNAGYGYLWWLLGAIALSPGVPDDAVAALGAADQKIYVIPSIGLVCCRQGSAAGTETEAESPFDQALLEALLAAVAT